MFTWHQSYLLIVEPPAQEIKIFKKQKFDFLLLMFSVLVSNFKGQTGSWQQNIMLICSIEKQLQTNSWESWV